MMDQFNGCDNQKAKKKGKKPNENKTFVDSPSSSKVVHA
jgi:hypothetical protein